MKGNVKIIVQNERIKYDFTLRRNITIIRGDSATGKTTMVELIRDYKSLGADSGVELFCEKNCVVIEGNDWKNQLSHVQQSIVFIDEGNRFVSSVEFSRFIQNTDNYYVLITREGLPTLPYSVEEIYGIRSSGKYGGIKPIYHEMYRMYFDKIPPIKIEPTQIITEDSNSGYQFFKDLCNDRNIKCISARGKSNICSELLKINSESVVVIADGAAFGPEMEKVYRLVKEKKNIALYLPESFEWLILISDVLNDREIKEMKKHWQDFIDCKKYFSWEQFFTELLIEKTQDTYLKYSKKTLTKAYQTEMIKSKIIEQINWWNINN